MPAHQCPRCGSYKTQSVRSMTVALGAILSIFIITLPVSAVLFLQALFMGGRKQYCRDCRSKFELVK